MSIPIRIHNEHTYDIRVTQFDVHDVPVRSYRISPNGLSPTFEADAPAMDGGHVFTVVDEDRLVALDPCAKTDVEELLPSDVENAQDETRPSNPEPKRSHHKR